MLTTLSGLTPFKILGTTLEINSLFNSCYLLSKVPTAYIVPDVRDVTVNKAQLLLLWLLVGIISNIGIYIL